MPIDAGATLSRSDARHLLRRTGFGFTQKQLDQFDGMSRGEAADTILDFKPTRYKPSAPSDDIERAHNKWLKYMIRTRHPIQEKLVLFWHDHFATNNAKVSDAMFMALQNRTLRANCMGNFRDLVKAINVDAAMMRFLDTNTNRKRVPNENYARELQELFTLGVKDFAGNDNYVQDDVAQIARAFTGWRFEDNGDPFLNDDQHDYTTEPPGLARGPKVIYQSTGGFGGAGRDFADQGEGPQEIDRVVDIIFEHTDTNGQNTVARRTTKRLLEYFARPGISTATIDEIISDSDFASSWSIQALLRSMMTHDDFYPAPGESTQNSVKWPIDFVVSTLRQLSMKLKSRDQYVNGGDGQTARNRLIDMGQEILNPPSVFGWDWETAWVSSASLLSRYAFIRDVTTARSGAGKVRFKPLKLVAPTITATPTSPAAIVDRVLEVLGVDDQLSVAERQALIDYMGPGPIDLADYDTQNRKLNGLFALVLQSPAFQVH